MASDNMVSRFRTEERWTDQERDYLTDLERYFASSIGSNVEKLENFPKYVPRQSLTRFLSRNEIFKRVLNVQGSIVECGVLFGGGLMTFAQLSSIYEPVNMQRKVIGFDTWSGFPEIHDKDQTGDSPYLQIGELAVDAYEDLEEAVRLFNENRFLGRVPMVELVKGDVKDTVPQYLEANPHTVVSLLYIDLDLYTPTKVALEHIVPRIPKGGVVAFDELNAKGWPGETVAALEAVGISNMRLERFSFDSHVCYAVME